VRHSILFALPGILARVNATQRRHLTVPSLVRLSQDPADTVRSGLLEVLGEVIYTFRDDPNGPPRELVDLFIPGEADWSADEVPGAFAQSIVSSPERMSYGSSTPSLSTDNMDASRNWFHDPERSIICAFNFPAVILALGRAKWPEVRGYYLHLSQNSAVKVLRTLAASLGEVAAIIGSANAEKDLMPIFLSSIRSEESEIRSKIIEAMPKFAEALSVKKRETLVAELPNLWSNLRNWREREELARLLGDMASLVGTRVNNLAEIMKQALRDEVAAVRDSAVLSVSLTL
jgi:serine/threonine-protein phosphatase 4 regulatory subunit 1